MDMRVVGVDFGCLGPPQRHDKNHEVTPQTTTRPLLTYGVHPFQKNALNDRLWKLPERQEPGLARPVEEADGGGFCRRHRHKRGSHLAGPVEIHASQRRIVTTPGGSVRKGAAMSKEGGWSVMCTRCSCNCASPTISLSCPCPNHTRATRTTRILQGASGQIHKTRQAGPWPSMARGSM